MQSDEEPDGDSSGPSKDEPVEPEGLAGEFSPDPGFDETQWRPPEGLDDPASLEALTGLAEFEPQDVPTILHSAFSEKEFDKCLLCDALLDEDPHGYQIQKSYRHSEVIVEFAICGSCAIKSCTDYSQESLEVLEVFFMSLFANLDQADRRCQACDRSEHNYHSFSVVGVCRREQLIFPLIRICSDCEGSLHERLSKKTRDIFGDFFRDNFPTVPEEVDLSPLKLF